MLTFAFPIIFFFSILCDHTPGTIQVDNNFYCDRTEVTHFHYREYVNWLLKIFGENSELWKNALPGQSKIDTSAGVKEILPSQVFLDPKFVNHPVVNISFEQATNFCQWRSDRIYENILVSHGLLGYNKDQDEKNFFTIKKYLDTLPEGVPFLPYPIFRLPTPVEWDAIVIHKLTDKKPYPGYSTVRFNIENRISGMLGNVAEMTSTRGISKGGSFKHVNANSEISYSEPAEWLGFRCVCSLVIDSTYSFHSKKLKNDFKDELIREQRIKNLKSLQLN